MTRLDIRMLPRLALVAAIVGAVAASFAWAGGWLSPATLTQARFIDTFERLDGPHPGFRRNHAKGICVSGWFDANGAGTRVSKAAVFRPGRVPVVGRFSLGGGMPFQADALGTVRALAVRFEPPDGEEWRTAMIDLPLFIVRTPEAFHDQLVATAPDPATGKAAPAKV